MKNDNITIKTNIFIQKLGAIIIELKIKRGMMDET